MKAVQVVTRIYSPMDGQRWLIIRLFRWKWEIPLKRQSYP